MLARTERNRDVARHQQAEHVLGVFHHAGRIAMAPDRVDFIDIRQLPVAQVMRRHAALAGDPLKALFRDADAGFLEHFAHRRLPQGFVFGILRPRYRLPVAGLVGALDQQHF